MTFRQQQCKKDIMQKEKEADVAVIVCDKWSKMLLLNICVADLTRLCVLRNDNVHELVSIFKKTANRTDQG